jgi:hypothetical protein
LKPKTLLSQSKVKSVTEDQRLTHGHVEGVVRPGAAEIGRGAERVDIDEARLGEGPRLLVDPKNAKTSLIVGLEGVTPVDVLIVINGLSLGLENGLEDWGIHVSNVPDVRGGVPEQYNKHNIIYHCLDLGQSEIYIRSVIRL